MTAARSPRPGDDDPSKPQRGGDYEYIKGFYQSAEVAADYDRHRFASPERERRNRRKWATITRALDRTDGVASVLDLPCGTGRFTGSLARQGRRVVGADIAAEMMRVAAQRTAGDAGVEGYARSDAERLPFRDGAFDCVLSIRFMMHVDPATRLRILREMARVSRRWLIVDYRHRYSLRYWTWTLRRSLGLAPKPLRRVGRQELQAELEAGGWSMVAILPVARFFSDKWIVVGEKR